MESRNFTASAEAQNPQNRKSDNAVKMDIDTPISKFSDESIREALDCSFMSNSDPFSLFVGFYDILRNILIFSEPGDDTVWSDTANLLRPLDFCMCLVQKALDIKS